MLINTARKLYPNYTKIYGKGFIELPNGEVLLYSGNDLKTFKLIKNMEFTKIVKGKKTRINLANGEVHEAQFALVELTEIKASHNEETFVSTVGYPTNSQGRNVNDRNYEKDKNAQASVLTIAQQLNPDLLISTAKDINGTPIISSEGVVVSGNGRTMALKLAQKKFQNKYEIYLQELCKEIDDFGFEHCETIGNIFKVESEGKEVMFQQAVLVRIDFEIKAYTTELLSKFNMDDKKGKKESDRKIERSAILKENLRCASSLQNTFGNFENFSDFYSNREAVKNAYDALLGCQFFTANQIPDYFDSEKIQFTEQGKRLLEGSLLALVMDIRSLDALDAEGMKTISNTILYSLLPLVENRDLGETTLLPEVNDAVYFEQMLKSSKQSVGDFMRQINAFDDYKPTERVLAIHATLLQGQRAFKQSIIRYNNGIENNKGSQMFASETLTPNEVFEKTILEGVKDKLPKVSSSKSVIVENKKEATIYKEDQKEGLIGAIDRHKIKELSHDLLNEIGAYFKTHFTVIWVEFGDSYEMGNAYNTKINALVKFRYSSNFSKSDDYYKYLEEIRSAFRDFISLKYSEVELLDKSSSKSVTVESANIKKPIFPKWLQLTFDFEKIFLHEMGMEVFKSFENKGDFHVSSIEYFDTFNNEIRINHNKENIISPFILKELDRQNIRYRIKDKFTILIGINENTLVNFKSKKAILPKINLTKIIEKIRIKFPKSINVAKKEIIIIKNLKLDKIAKKYAEIQHNEDNYSIGGGLANGVFASNRHQDAKFDEGKLTEGKATQLFKNATDLDTETVKGVINTAIPNKEWHHAGKLPKQYGGGMKKTYFLNAAQLVDLATNWDKYAENFIIFNLAKKAKDQEKKDLEQKKNDFLKANATKRVRIEKMPTYFIVTGKEMNGKHGWFNSWDKSYNMTEYYTGWEFENEQTYKNYFNL